MFFITLLLLSQEVPYSWEELHKTASENPKNFKILVEDYKENFPCEMCRKNFKKEVAEMEKFFPLSKISTTHEASIWAWIVHNSVNIRLDKPWYSYNDLLFALTNY